MAKTIEFAPQGGATGKICLQLPNTDATDLDFSRTSGAMVKNENGVLEDALPNIPRYNFEEDGCPVLLLEPQSTNLVSYSFDFINSWYDKRNVSVLSNEILSPKASLFADKIVEDTSNDYHSIRRFTPTSANVATYTYSIYAKCDSSKRDLNIFIELDNYTRSAEVLFDLDNGVVISESGVGLIKSDILSLSNGWFRCIVTFDTTTGDIKSIKNRLNNNGSDSYLGDGTSGIYVWNTQLEEQLSATSPIETNGTIETRTKDTASKSGLENYINSSEGTFYFYGKGLSNSNNNRFISLSDNSGGSNFVQIRLNTSNKLQCRIFKNSSGVGSAITDNSTNTLNYYKCAIVWSSTKFALFVNGSKVSEQLIDASFTSNILDTLTFNNEIVGGSSNYDGKVKELEVYTTALTDQELIDLTTI